MGILKELITAAGHLSCCYTTPPSKPEISPPVSPDDEFLLPTHPLVERTLDLARQLLQGNLSFPEVQDSPPILNVDLTDIPTRRLHRTSGLAFINTLVSQLNPAFSLPNIHSRLHSLLNQPLSPTKRFLHHQPPINLELELNHQLTLVVTCLHPTRGIISVAFVPTHTDPSTLNSF